MLLPGLHVVGWFEVAEACLVALTVVEHFDELGQVVVCLGLRREVNAAADPCDVDFESCPQGSHGCVDAPIGQESSLTDVMSVIPLRLGRLVVMRCGRRLVADTDELLRTLLRR